ncbi:MULTISPECIES: DUF4209 domain-containing protein [unclassified Modestobacter]
MDPDTPDLQPTHEGAPPVGTAPRAGSPEVEVPEAGDQDRPPESRAPHPDEGPAQPSAYALVQLADEVFAVSDNWWAVADALTRTAQDVGLNLDSPGLVALRFGVRVALRERLYPGRRRPEVVLEPVDLPLGSRPTRPRDATAEAAELWRRIGTQARHPATRARFLDLLVVRGGPGTPATAAAAMRAYLDLARLGRYRVAEAPEESVRGSTPGEGSTQVEYKVAAAVEPAVEPEVKSGAEAGGEDGADADGGETIARGADPTSPPGTESSSFLDVEWAGRSVDLAICRALTLARIANHHPDGPPAADDALTLALDTAEHRLADPLRAATAIGLLQFAAAAAVLSPDDRTRLLRLADSASIRLADRPWLVDAAAAVLITLDPTRRAMLDERRVAAHVAAADGRPPAARLLLLDQAAALAHSLQRPDLADPVTRELQAMDKSSLGLTPVRHAVSLPAEIIDTAIEHMSHGPDWRSALHSWLNSDSPTGNPAATENAVRRLRETPSLANVLPTVLLGAGQLPRWRAREEGDEAARERARLEEHHIRLQGFLLAEALDQVGAKGSPTEAELTIYLDDLGAEDPLLAAALARAFSRYWAGDFEAVVHTAVPRIEAAARALVLELDQAAYQVARAKEPGKYVGLGVLLSILAEVGLDPAWERFLRTFLTGPLGMNVRNDVAHGFVLRPPTREIAALAVRALAVLTLLVAADVAEQRPADDSILTAWPGTIVDAAAFALRLAARDPRRLPILIAAEVRSMRRVLTATLFRRPRR